MSHERRQKGTTDIRCYDGGVGTRGISTRPGGMVKCYCENGHLIERSPSYIKTHKTTPCGKCGAHVKFRPLTDLELKDYEWMKSPKNNCLSVSIRRKSKMRAAKYSRKVNYGIE